MNIVTFLDSKDNIPLTTKYLCIKVKKSKRECNPRLYKEENIAHVMEYNNL